MEAETSLDDMGGVAWVGDISPFLQVVTVALLPLGVVDPLDVDPVGVALIAYTEQIVIIKISYILLVLGVSIYTYSSPKMLRGFPASRIYGC
jgi:hypothetical protein